MTVEQRQVSPTQRALDDDVVARLVAAALPGGEVTAWERLSGGQFATVARVDLRDGREVVLKVGPAPSVKLLTYEHGMVGAEARYLAQLGPALLGAPVPELLASGSGGVIDGEWMLVSLLPGRSLNRYVDEAKDADAADPSGPVRRQLGALLARIHTLTSTAGVFGYDDPARPHGATWPEAFSAMIEALLADAETWRVELPASAGRIRAAVRAHEPALAEVVRPTLVHFDLWDGNVLAAPADGELRLTGIVDGERFFHGDRLIDFVSPALGRRIELEPEHPFVAGYRAATGWTDAFTGSELRRLALYRLHLYLLMYVEMPSRGMGRDTHGWRWDWIHRLLSAELDHLERLAEPGCG